MRPAGRSFVGSALGKLNYLIGVDNVGIWCELKTKLKTNMFPVIYNLMPVSTGVRTSSLDVTMGSIVVGYVAIF